MLIVYRTERDIFATISKNNEREAERDGKRIKAKEG